MTIIKIELPERFIAALEKLAEKGMVLPEFTPVNSTEPVPFDKELPEETPASPITPEMIRARLAPLLENGKQEEVKALIKKYGGGKLTDVPKDQYPALLKDAEML
ncbi:MAG: hypothetical protein SCK57_10420 [Bacillota bacterium]|nr:hypothetical protein [Bacillota bacterium]MDW7678063.1 hypothetical protein [Bacillota bacterium]